MTSLWRPQVANKLPFHWAFPAWTPAPTPFMRLEDNIVVVHSISPLGVVAIVPDGYDGVPGDIEYVPVDLFFEEAGMHGYTQC